MVTMMNLMMETKRRKRDFKIVRYALGMLQASVFKLVRLSAYRRAALRITQGTQTAVPSRLTPASSLWSLFWKWRQLVV